MVSTDSRHLRTSVRPEDAISSAAKVLYVNALGDNGSQLKAAQEVVDTIAPLLGPAALPYLQEMHDAVAFYVGRLSRGIVVRGHPSRQEDDMWRLVGAGAFLDKLRSRIDVLQREA